MASPLTLKNNGLPTPGIIFNLPLKLFRNNQFMGNLFGDLDKEELLYWVFDDSEAQALIRLLKRNSEDSFFLGHMKDRYLIISSIKSEDPHYYYEIKLEKEGLESRVSKLESILNAH